MIADPYNPERREPGFSSLPQSPTDFDRVPEDPAAQPSDPAGERLLLIPAAYIVAGAIFGALVGWLTKGDAATERGIAVGALYGAGVGLLLALLAFFVFRRRDRDQKFAGPDSRRSSEGEWAGVRDIMRRQREHEDGLGN